MTFNCIVWYEGLTNVLRAPPPLHHSQGSIRIALGPGKRTEGKYLQLVIKENWVGEITYGGSRCVLKAVAKLCDESCMVDVEIDAEISCLT